MARIAGIDIPKNKRGLISLTYILGIGRTSAKNILAKANVDENLKVNEWNEENESFKIRRVISFLSSTNKIGY